MHNNNLNTHIKKPTFATNLNRLNLDIDFLIENSCLIFHIDSNHLHFSTNTSDYFNLAQQLEFITGLSARYFALDKKHIEEEIDLLRQNRNLSLIKDKSTELAEIDFTEDFLSDAPVVKFIDTILEMAIEDFASDIHFEPYEQNFRIRFRLDGILQEVKKLPLNASDKIQSRLKIMAKLDISEKRLPQDGSLKINLKGEVWDIRVNSLPTIYGEKIVLRILDKRQSQIGIDQLGMLDEQKAIYLQGLKKPQGMLLITGPTGSGKTVTLYTGLGILNTDKRNITTAEDPVEIKLEGINQVNIQPKIGLDFSACLRAFLRQDPDVIMLGEIRDLETAKVAIKAAQTGHLLLSTLHTNSAIESIGRLVNIGIAKYNLADSLQLIGAQRLVRKLCNFCKEAYHLTKKQLEIQGFTTIETYLKKILKTANLTQLSLYRAGEGCENCNQGYRGRIGIFELLPIDEKLKNLLLGDASLADINKQAKISLEFNLYKAGLCKVAQGITSLEELKLSVLEK